jgi:hypothetical protein
MCLPRVLCRQALLEPPDVCAPSGCPGRPRGRRRPAPQGPPAPRPMPAWGPGRCRARRSQRTDGSRELPQAQRSRGRGAAGRVPGPSVGSGWWPPPPGARRPCAWRAVGTLPARVIVWTRGARSSLRAGPRATAHALVGGATSWCVPRRGQLVCGGRQGRPAARGSPQAERVPQKHARGCKTGPYRVPGGGRGRGGTSGPWWYPKPCPTRACRRRRTASAPTSLSLSAAPDAWR